MDIIDISNFNKNNSNTNHNVDPPLAIDYFLKDFIIHIFFRNRVIFVSNNSKFSPAF